MSLAVINRAFQKIIAIFQLFKNLFEFLTYIIHMSEHYDNSHNKRVIAQNYAFLSILNFKLTKMVKSQDYPGNRSPGKLRHG